MHDSPQQRGEPPPGGAPWEGEASPPGSPPPASAADGDARAEISWHVDAIVAAIEREADSVRENARREAELGREEARREAELRLDDAHARADALLAERQARIATLSDELLRKSEAIVGRLSDPEPARRGFEHLIRALADTAERLARFGGAPQAQARAEPPATRPYGPDDSRARTQGPDPALATPGPGALGAEAVDEPAPSDAPRIVASEMASAGASRASVRAYLTDALGVTEPEPFLDHAFGRRAG